MNSVQFNHSFIAHAECNHVYESYIISVLLVALVELDMLLIRSARGVETNTLVSRRAGAGEDLLRFFPTSGWAMIAHEHVHMRILCRQVKN